MDVYTLTATDTYWSMYYKTLMLIFMKYLNVID